MKLKKALSGILAAAMVVSLTPAMAFASTTNTVANVYTVAADDEMPTVALNLKLTNNSSVVKADNVRFKISLENAEFKKFGASGSETQTAALVTNSGVALKTSASAVVDFSFKTGGSYAVQTTTGAITVANKSEDEMTLSLSNLILNSDDYITLYLNLKSGNEDGEVKVSIEQLDSILSGGTYTVATVSNSVTTANVSGKVKAYPRKTGVVGLGTEISETAVNAITGNQILKLTLPKGMKWEAVKITGDLCSAVSIGGIKTPSSAVGGTYVPTPSAISTTSAGLNCFSVENDGRTLYVHVGITDDPNVRQSLTIVPTFEITKDANKGDITLSVAGYKADSGDKVANESGLIIAKYGDESVNVSCPDDDNLPEIVAGYKLDDSDKDFVVKVKIKEELGNSLSSGRFIDFDFNDEIAIKTDGVVKYSLSTGSPKYENATPINQYITQETDVKNDCSQMTLEVPAAGDSFNTSGSDWDTGKGKTLTVFIPVTAKANYTGDVTVNVSGAKAGIESTDLVVGKVVAPLSIETEVSKVVNGAKGQALANIKIVENKTGYLDSNDTITLDLDTIFSDAFAFDKAEVKVTSGDMDVKKTVNDGSIVITVKDPSTTAATVEVSGITADLARTLPEGVYEVDALVSSVDNETYSVAGADKKFKKVVDSAEFVNVITAADTQVVGVNAQFVIGEASYTNNGAATEMDAAAYIDSHNRTMVPIRYVANACGISENDIRWEAGSQTAIINGANTVVTVKMGSNKLQTSTGEITMDTAAVNNNGRIYVPVRYIANALGANVSWDAVTKTVTLTK